MTLRWLSAILCISSVFPARTVAEERKLQVLYVGAESDSGRGLLRGYCEVLPAAVGGTSFAVGGRQARDVSSLATGDAEAIAAVVLDADAAAGIREADASALAQYVSAGGKLVVEGCDGYVKPLAAVLPVKAAAPQVCGGEVSAPEPSHPALLGVPFGVWELDGTEVASTPKTDARVLLRAGEAALVTIGTAGRGKVIATPLTHQAGRYAWTKTPGYDSLLTLLTLAVAVAPDDVLLRESWASAYRYWMYACFGPGYCKYRFDAKGPAIDTYDEAETHLTAARRALDGGDLPRCGDLIRKGLEAAQRAGEGSRGIGGTITAGQAEAAATRRDLLRLPGTLDVVHSMNISEGPRGSAVFWYPATGRMLLDDRPNLDLPPGASASFWRGLHPYIIGSGILPTEPDADRLWQKRADGSRIDGPNREIWIHPVVKALQAQTLSDAHAGAVVNHAGGAEWNTYGSSPDADFSEFAQAAFRIYLAERGLSPADLGANEWGEVSPPTAWAPGRLYYEWQCFRRLYLRERLKTNYWAMKLVAPDSWAGLQPGALGDPWRVSVDAEACDYLDLLCPLVVRGAGGGLDPADVEAACRELWSLTDADGDGRPDQGLGYAARFAWGDPLALAPEAHRSVAGIALLSGASGIMESWAPDGKGGDAVAESPEEVFLRWQAAFEPAIRHESLFLESAPAAATVGVWQSWHNAAMAQGAGQPGAADSWALSQPREWMALLTRAGFTSRLVYDRHLRKGGFLGLPCIVVPSTLCVSDDEVGQLTRFCEEGGALILGCGAAAFDAYHVGRAAGLAELAGLQVGPPKVREERVKATRVGAGARQTGGEALTLGHVAQSVESIADAVEVASSADQPLVCVRQLGKGTVVYFGATVWAGDGPTQMLVRDTLASAGLRQRAWVKDAAGGSAWQARALVMDHGSGALVGVAHYRPYAEQQPLSGLEVGVRMGAGRHVVYRLSDARPFVRNDGRRERVEFSATNGYTTFKTDLQPYEVKLFLIEPA